MEGDNVSAGLEVIEGIASIALLPSGSISGHFVSVPNSVCYGLQGTGILITLSPYFMILTT